MNDIEEMNRRIRIHRRKKRRRRMTALFFCMAVLSIVLFLFKDRLTQPKVQPVAAVPPETETSVPEEVTETSAPTPDREITVSLMGDCTLGTDPTFNFSTSLNAYYANYGSDYFFSNVKSILEADDLSIVNMEGPLTTAAEPNGEVFSFKGDPEFVNILTDGSVEAANLANNHSHDYGDQGLTDTGNILSSAGVTPFGYDETAILDIKGVKVGLVGIYELRDHLERMQQLKDLIDKVKREGAELVITVFHWGNERDTLPDYNQITLAHAAIDQGSDLVAGHHSHVLQGIEKYRGKNIVYGLGNFCFGGNTAPADMDTMIFQQTFTIQQDGVLLNDVTNIVPCRISSEWGYNNYQPTPATGEEADRILLKIKERSGQIAASNL